MAIEGNCLLHTMQSFCQPSHDTRRTCNHSYGPCTQDRPNHNQHASRARGDKGQRNKVGGMKAPLKLVMQVQEPAGVLVKLQTSLALCPDV
jgi:hypothetical protein